MTSGHFLKGIYGFVLAMLACACGQPKNVQGPVLQARWYLDRKSEPTAPKGSCMADLYLAIVNVGETTIESNQIWVKGREECYWLPKTSRGKEPPPPLTPGGLRILYLGNFCHVLPTAVQAIIDGRRRCEYHAKIPIMPSALPGKLFEKVGCPKDCEMVPAERKLELLCEHPEPPEPPCD